MRIAQIILPEASPYERKSQRIDFAALSSNSEVTTTTLEGARSRTADVAHIYATGLLSPSAIERFPLPYISSAGVGRRRWPFRQVRQPARIVSPLEGVSASHLPEAVEDEWFDPVERRGPARRVVGSFARDSIRNVVGLTLARIQRFRDDVEWLMLEREPTPRDMERIDLWVDPTPSGDDFDGFVAEALVAGVGVIAARTQINWQRLEKGRTGILVPPGDPNELTHAILTALFKPEAIEAKVAAARQTASKFRARRRLRILTDMYESLLS